MNCYAFLAFASSRTLDELAGISGGGTKKVEAYGPEILWALTNA
jgi:hypothetical protein